MIPTACNRRQAFTFALACLVGRTTRADDPTTEAEEIKKIRQQAQDAGLKPLQSRSQPGSNFLVLGEAPADFLLAALRLCDGLERDYLNHFQARRFPVRKPPNRLIVIVLSGPAAYSQFLGQPQDEAVGGHYDLETNRLIIFDNRARQDPNPLAGRANTVALMHESMHQLCFNTGLLSRGTAVPVCVSEGLAMYAEVRTPDGRTPIGRVNRPRIGDLADPTSGTPRLTVADLFQRPTLFDDSQTARLAYAWSWVLVHHLMQLNSPQLAGFREYLDALRSGKTQALSRLGDLEALDRAVIRHAARLSSRG